MSVNKYQPHVLVLPEDDANRQLANGFQLDPCLKTTRMQILEKAGGWQNVLLRFQTDQVAEMDLYKNRFMVLLIDFDRKEDRLTEVLGAVPERLRERVFVLGAWSNPEDLRQALGSYEHIGQTLSRNCRDATDSGWEHKLLRHNAAEVERLRDKVRPFLFSGS